MGSCVSDIAGGQQAVDGVNADKYMTSQASLDDPNRDAHAALQNCLRNRGFNALSYQLEVTKYKHIICLFSLFFPENLR
uniref:Uncharacterized protein n=1 Tax=Picea sitchensis TaxID=3332 RepID=A9NN38_PICSI|nr:unknown [Picea sitchensis]